MNVKGRIGIRDFDTRKLTMEGLRGAIVLALLILVVSTTFAQQSPPGRVAYTKYPLGGLDPKELWLTDSNHANNHQLFPSIALGGFPGFASVASIGVPVWSKDGRLIAANAILSSNLPGDLTPLQQLIWNQLTLATPTNVLVVFDPTTNVGNAVFNLDTQTGTASGVVSSLWISAAFSPESKRLAYTQQELNFTGYGVINIDGTGKTPLGLVNLTENALGLGIDWSPRTDALGNFGNLIAISRSRSFQDPTCLNIPRSVAALDLIDAQGKLVRPLPRPPQIPCSIWVFDTVNDLWPTFSPDGMQLAFVRSVRDSMSNVTESRIMLVKVDGTPYADGMYSHTLLYLPGKEVDHLSWSPDGSRLMFDQTVMAYGGLYPIPLGVFTTSSAGDGDLSAFLAPPASAAAWGRPQ